MSIVSLRTIMLSRLHRLSHRQLEMLLNYADGFGTIEMMPRMGLSHSRVCIMRRQIIRNLGMPTNNRQTTRDLIAFSSRYRADIENRKRNMNLKKTGANLTQAARKLGGFKSIAKQIRGERGRFVSECAA